MSEQHGTGRWRRPDASMSLLADLFAGGHLDPGYARAAARRASAGDRPSRSGRRGLLLAAGVLFGLLGAMALVQVHRGEPAARRQRTELVSQIRRQTAETDGLQRQVEGVRTQTERLRRSALERSEAGRRARADLDQASAAAAGTAVRGDALVITVDDARGRDPDGRIYDGDLQGLVNALWASGATAIGVNGQRMTTTTAIRRAGDAILVDYRPLTPPYTVTAIGDAGAIRHAFNASRTAIAFRDLKAAFGTRFDLGEEDGVRLPAAPSPRLRYAREAGPR